MLQETQYSVTDEALVMKLWAKIEELLRTHESVTIQSGDTHKDGKRVSRVRLVIDGKVFEEEQLFPSDERDVNADGKVSVKERIDSAFTPTYTPLRPSEPVKRKTSR